jgi:SMODS and SLOG-associating 2TM effector domain 2
MVEESKDLTIPATSAAFAWDTADVEGSLSRLKVFASSRAAEAVSYYRRIKQPKKWWAIRLRVLSLVFAGISGILPLISQIWADSQGRPVIAPAWASVFLALAAGAIAIDRYFGFSSAWMRFMTSELKISRALDQFELDWEATRAGIDTGTGGAVDTATVLMDRARHFVAEVADIVGGETAQWMSEFRETIRQLDERTGRPLTRSAPVSGEELEEESGG